MWGFFGLFSKRSQKQQLEVQVYRLQEIILNEQKNSIKLWEAIIEVHEQALDKLQKQSASEANKKEIYIEQRFVNMFKKELQYLKKQYETMNKGFYHDRD